MPKKVDDTIENEESSKPTRKPTTKKRTSSLKEEKINDIAFRNILNSRSMLLEQPDYKKQRKIHSEEGKDDEQTD